MSTHDNSCLHKELKECVKFRFSIGFDKIQVSKSQKNETLVEKIAALMKIHQFPQSPDYRPINKTIARFSVVKKAFYLCLNA
jgi:hypothetical protein